ncbi:hypothetical protein T10_10176 [Trichinella papuae]|uniref:Uncharacterized protein n=1 Tax=Trichinella papuae TaxID=268474 RepID=A0A0V1MBA3_9BILA|nr:hypothetical protein T10_10176 [Trichinella papuae]
MILIPANYVKTVEQRWLRYTSCQRGSLCISFSMMPVLMATRVPLPIKAFPWRLTMEYVKSNSYVAHHPGTMIIQVGIIAFLDSSTVDYVTPIAASCHCGIASWLQCVPKVQQIASTQSELPLSHSRHHSYQNGMSAFTSVSIVVSRASSSRSVLVVVAMKAIHSGSQFRVAYGKEYLDLHVQKFRELGSGVQVGSVKGSALYQGKWCSGRKRERKCTLSRFTSHVSDFRKRAEITLFQGGWRGGGQHKSLQRMTQGRPHGGERLRLWLCCLPAHLNLPIVFVCAF